MELVVREAELKDVEDIFGYSKETELGKRHFSSLESLKECITKWICLWETYVVIDKDSNKNAGVMVYTKEGMCHDYPYIKFLVVNPEYQRKGIGSGFIELAEGLAESSKVDKLWLFVADFNEGAQKFYEVNGFEKVGEVKEMWTPGVTDYLMLKRIKKEA